MSVLPLLALLVLVVLGLFVAGLIGLVVWLVLRSRTSTPAEVVQTPAPPR